MKKDRNHELAPPGPSPAGRRIQPEGFSITKASRGILALACALATPALQAAPTNRPALNLESVLRIAEGRSPSLQAAKAKQTAAEQRARAAGLPPNPRIVVGTEGFRGGRNGEVLTGLSQSIPVGSERKLDREAARAERKRTAFLADAERLQLHQRVRGAFATALFAQASELLFAERIEILRSRLRLARARAEAGDSTMEAGELAHAALDHEQLAHEEALAQRALALQALATAMGQPDREIDSVQGDLAADLALESIRTIVANLNVLPAARAADQAAITAELRARQKIASRIPALNLNLLHRRDRSARKSGADVNLSFSVPLFDNKRAAARAFEADAEAARQTARTLRQQARLTYRRILADLETTLKRQKHIRDEILPHHERIVARQRALYEAGETRRDEWETARLDLSKERRHYYEALGETHRLWAQLAALAQNP
jgi:cobalt-zinc-cadmium efflux system outer membrane protein